MDLKKLKVKNNQISNKEISQTQNLKNLQFENFHKKFKKRTIFESVNLEIEKGKIYLLVGANGSGKSTFLNMLLGLIKTTKGKIIYNDFTISGYTNNVPFFNNLSIKENIDYLQENINKEKLEEYINMFSVNEYMEKKIKECSLGMRKKAILTFCLANENDIIILDEPTSNLDFKNRTIFYEILYNKLNEGKTIIITTNVIDDDYISLADYVLSLENKDIKLIPKKDLKFIYVINFENNTYLDKYILDFPNIKSERRGNFLFLKDQTIQGDHLSLLFNKYGLRSFKKEYLIGENNDI